jgi:hypothetical protein
VTESELEQKKSSGRASEFSVEIFHSILSIYIIIKCGSCGHERSAKDQTKKRDRKKYFVEVSLPYSIQSNSTRE